MRGIVTGLVLLALGASLQAQGTAVAGQKFAWDQPAPTLSDAQGYTYRYYADGATTGVAFTGVTCSGTASPFTCEVPIPAFTPGSHSVTVTGTNIAGEAPKCPPLTFSFVVTPGVATNLRIK